MAATLLLAGLTLALWAGAAAGKSVSDLGKVPPGQAKKDLSSALGNVEQPGTVKVPPGQLKKLPKPTTPAVVAAPVVEDIAGGNGKGKGSDSGATPQKTSAEPTTPAPAPAVTAPAATTAPTTSVGQSPAPTRPAVRRRPAGSRPARRARRRSASRPGAARSVTVAAPITDAATRGGSSSTSAPKHGARTPERGGPAVPRTVRDIVKVVPQSVRRALAGLLALSVLLAAGSLFAALRARRLERQRGELLQDVGLLQRALLPPPPDTLEGVRASVAYRPADGPGAGGDFYDVLALPGGCSAFILGDVSGHGRRALERTAFLRYTLRAYLEAGLEPRSALQVAGRVIDGKLGGDFATVILAVHDPDAGALTYASAGHPPPIFLGPAEHDPVVAAASPPVGVGMRTGLRQTTVPLPAGSLACLYTDGLAEARLRGGGLLGRERLSEMVRELGRTGAAGELLERIAGEARAVPDDMAACFVAPTAGVTAGRFRTEQLELPTAQADGPLASRFLAACGIDDADAREAAAEAREVAKLYGGAVLQVLFGNRRQVEVLPRNVESIEAASLRAVAT